MRIEKKLLYCFLIIFLFLPGCDKSEDDQTIIPQNGEWIGNYSGLNTGNDDIVFHVNDGFVSDISVFLYFTNTSITINKVLFFAEPINGHSFKYDSGEITDSGGNIKIDGTFTSVTECEGTVMYEEDSYARTGNASFYFYANLNTSNIPINVSDIASLRAGNTDGTLYKLTSEAILIFTTETYERNHKYIQDATGGILIDDYDGIITTNYNRYDGITGITGTLSEYKGMLEFTPTTDPGPATSTNNSITIQTVTIQELNSNFENYESELISITGVTFDAANGSNVFQSGGNEANYNISDGSNNLVFRVNYPELNYVGEIIPSGSRNIVGIPIRYYDTIEIFARDKDDISSK